MQLYYHSFIYEWFFAFDTAAAAAAVIFIWGLLEFESTRVSIKS